MLHDVLQHLEALVAFDTRNPPRAIGTGGIFDYLRAQSAGLPCRGHRPRRRRGVAAGGARRRRRACSTCTWTPCRTRRTGARIRIALRVLDGSRDRPGRLRHQGRGGLPAGGGARPARRCRLPVHHRRGSQRRRAASPASSPATHGFSEAIVAEPTRGEAVLAHRGISSVLMRFKGEAGHASGHATRSNQRPASRRCAGAAGAGSRRGAGAPAASVA